LRIGLVAPAVNGITGIFISNVVNILLSLTDDLYLITANADPHTFDKVRVISVSQMSGSNPFSRAMAYAWFQLKTAFVLARTARHVDFFVFFLCEEHFLPMLAARLFRKKVALALGGYTDLELRLQKNIFHRLMKLMREIDFSLSAKILVYSPNVVKDWGLVKYRDKIAIAHEHFLDFNTFKTRKPFSERANLVGYVGRLSEEKGVLNLVEAVPRITGAEKDFRLVLAGEGHLRGQIEEFIDKAGLDHHVSLAGWISHDQVPAYLNDFRLLVLPSYTEGLPNVMLEAMACGTPVLATAVGSISQFISDGQTGYIMENNSPECIAGNILRALRDPDLKRVGLSGQALVKEKFTFEEAVKGYRLAVESISRGSKSGRI
jgi:glycosyltransferase involved in cell wall biosynthesis